MDRFCRGTFLGWVEQAFMAQVRGGDMMSIRRVGGSTKFG